MILYIEYLKDSTKKLLELINECDKPASHKINTQKSIAFLYPNNGRWELESQETTRFITVEKWMKYLGINLPK